MKIIKKDAFPNGTICPKCEKELVVAHILKLEDERDRAFCPTEGCGNDVTHLITKIDFKIL